MKKRRRLWLFLPAVLALAFLSCATEADYTYRAESYEKKQPWLLTLAGQRGDSCRLMFTGPLLGNSSVAGEAFLEEDGSWLIYLDSLEWFHNHSRGWTEGRFSLQGALRLTPRGEEWHLNVTEEPLIENVVSAKIRYKDNIISGDRARDQLKRRWMRIDALQELLHEKLSQPFYPYPEEVPKKKREPRFDRDLCRLLFPEISGHRESTEPPSHPVETVRAEGVLWDMGYTEGLLPEEWRELRDSGTLYRDYEEALPLFWILYNWDYFWHEELGRMNVKFRGE